MTRFMTILASLALTAAFTPIAANATIVTPLAYVQIAAHQAIAGPLPEVQHVSANSTAATASGPMGQGIVQSGSANQKYPDSFGG
jgi:hypothetical protein